MTSEYYIPAALETYLRDGTYQSQFLRWKGFVDRNPILRAIMNANADAVTASWRTEGENAGQVARIFDGMRGNGKETFKLIFNNAIKVAKIGGDYYAEIVYDSVDGIEGDVPTDLVTLPPNQIRQNIHNGRIKSYENTHTNDKFKPEEIFHLAYNPIGAQTHGNSVIEPMNNILIHMDALIETGCKIFEKYTKPMKLIYCNTDSTTEMQKISDAWEDAFKTTQADMFIPKDIVDRVETIGVPQYSTLNPADWHRVLMNHLIMSCRVPELALGTGSVNSEESAKMQMMGFVQMVRWDQKFLEENLRFQLINQIFPDNTPSLKFSFATEAQDEKWNRMMQTFQTIGAAQLPPQLKILLQTKILIELGLIPNA